MKHWINKYLGKRWHRDYDCFVHFAEVQLNEFGVKDVMTLENVPKVPAYKEAVEYVKTNETVIKNWRRVGKHKEGDAIIFSSGDMSFHIGTYVDIDGGGVLHCNGKQGVVFTPMRIFIQHGNNVDTILRHRGLDG